MHDRRRHRQRPLGLTLRDDLAGATGTDAAGLTTVGQSLVAVHDATFLLGPAFCAGLGNGLLLGYLMYKTGLVPRRMAMIGLVGGPLALVTATAVLLGAWEQTSATGFFFTVPEIVWEASLSIYCCVNGFRTPSPSLGQDRPGRRTRHSARRSRRDNRERGSGAALGGAAAHNEGSEADATAHDASSDRIVAGAGRARARRRAAAR